MLQSENGLLGIGPYPFVGEEDPDLIKLVKKLLQPFRDPHSLTAQNHLE